MSGDGTPSGFTWISVVSLGYCNLAINDVQLGPLHLHWVLRYHFCVPSFPRLCPRLWFLKQAVFYASYVPLQCKHLIAHLNATKLWFQMLEPVTRGSHTTVSAENKTYCERREFMAREPYCIPDQFTPFYCFSFFLFPTCSLPILHPLAPTHTHTTCGHKLWQLIKPITTP